MQITCANCKTNYTLTAEQISGLSFSILPCKQCNKFIKITTCPHCQSFYSITFTSTQQARYSLICERCAKSFTIEFPLIREPKPAGEELPAPHVPPGPALLNRQTQSLGTTGHTLSPGMFRPSAHPVPATSHSATRKEKGIKPPLFGKSLNKISPAPAKERPLPQNKYSSGNGSVVSSLTGADFTLSDLFLICGKAFTPSKLIVAAVGIFLSFLLITGFSWLVSGLIGSPGNLESNYLKSMLNIVPFALVFFIYILSASMISRITMDSINSGSRTPAAGPLEFLGRSFFPVFIANIALFLAIELILILFGKIPIVGPVIFALMFLPIYAVSICIILIVAVGFWFYPPIIAGNSGGMTALPDMFRFIRRQNFSLAYTVPLMAIVTAVTFAAIYLLHYGSFSLSMFLTKNLLAEEGEKIFSAVPPSFLSMSDLTIQGSDSGLFKAFVGNLFLSHTIGGLIIGLIFSLISILLFASFVSISATLSTHLYLMMDRGRDIDDRSKLRVLLLLVLILAGVFLIKKIFF